MQLTVSGARARHEALVRELSELRREFDKLEVENRVLLGRVEALRQEGHEKEARHGATTTTMALALRHPSPLVFSVPLGSGWVRAPLSLEMIQYPERVYWDPQYDRNVLSPIFTGIEGVPPHMRPGSNLVDVIIPVTLIAGGVFALMQMSKIGCTAFLEKGYCITPFADVFYDGIFSKIMKENSGGVVKLFDSGDEKCCPTPTTSLVDSCFTTDHAWFSYRSIWGFRVKEGSHLEYMTTLEGESLVWVPFTQESISSLPFHQRGLVTKVALKYMYPSAL